MNGNGDTAASAGESRAAKLFNDFGNIDVVEIVVVLALTWLVIRLARRGLPWLAAHVPSVLRLYLIGAVPFIRLALLLFAITWIVPIVFNLTLQNFFVIAGAVGVAIGFAFKDFVSSIVAGVVAIVERPYRPGDWVEVGDDYGEVLHVGMRSIRIRTPSDDVVTVPHLRIWEENVVNSNDGARTLMVVTEFHVDPDHDAAALRSALRDVALTSAYLDCERPILVVLEERPWGTRYELKAYPFDMRDQFLFRSDLVVRGKRAIVESGARELSVPMLGGETGRAPDGGRGRGGDRAAP